MSRDFTEIAGRVKTLRKTLELTQEAFGRPVELRRQDVRAIETGKRQLGLLTVLRLGDTYNVSLDWLILGKGEPPVKE